MIFSKSFQKDIRTIAKEYLLRIPSQFRIALIISFLITTCVFAIFTNHYILHNHYPRLPFINYDEQLTRGRWFGGFWFWISNLTDVPVFNPLFGALLSVISALVTFALWNGTKIDQRTPVSNLVIISLLITIYPAMSSTYYFTWMTSLYMGGLLLSTLGLYVSSSFSAISIISGAVLLLLAMASYQPSISVISLLLVSVYILRLIELKQIRDILRSDILPKTCSFILSLILYVLSLNILGINSGDEYQTSTIRLNDIPHRFLEVLFESFHALVYTQPEILLTVKSILLLSNLICLFTLMWRLNNKSKCKLHLKIFLFAILIFLSTMLVVSTKAMFLISPDNSFSTYRLNLSMGFFYSFCFFIILKYINKPIFQSFVIVMACFILLRFSQSNLVRQGLLLRTIQHDISLTNRILVRIEQLEDLNINKKYLLVRTGMYPAFYENQIRHHERTYEKGGEVLMTRDFSEQVFSQTIMSQLGSKIRFQKYKRKLKKKRIKQAMKIAKKQKRIPWPHPSSVFIHNDWIIVYIK
jgi:hypothetical protein